jgi:hypothetical protein
MMNLDRGFKSWAERTSIALRREMGLTPKDPLDPLQLANVLEVNVWTPQKVPGIPEEVIDQLLYRDPWGWSAVSLLLADGHGLLIYNPRKSRPRQASDITHELAHFILDHQPATIILSSDGNIAMRTFDKKQEEEANWLAFCLLVPREALVLSRRDGLNAGQIANRYGVSETLVTFRLNVSGVEAQIRARQKYRKKT